MHATKTYFTYIVTNKPRGTLYTGVTNDLQRRSFQHVCGQGSKFTTKYRLKYLVWYEGFCDVETAILYEKRIKRWRRAWKFDLIEGLNPNWNDLSVAHFGRDPRSSRG
ncbi:MAG: GIY-YIG nuclease family protein [Pseudomonadota bacterium]